MNSRMVLADLIARYRSGHRVGIRYRRHPRFNALRLVVVLLLAPTACFAGSATTINEAVIIKAGTNPPGLKYTVVNRTIKQPGREPGNTEGSFGKFITYPAVTDLLDKVLEKKINARIEAFIGLHDLLARERAVEVTYAQGPDLGCCLQFHFTLFSEGGAHPFTAKRAIVLSLETDAPYTLKGLFLPKGQAPLQRWIVQGLLEHYQAGFVDEFQVDESTSFSFDADNLYLYFSDCEVFSCSAGPAVITISLELLRPYIDPKGPLAFLL